MASPRDSSVCGVNVCLICGDKGETKLLIYCRMCRDSAVHHYCMDNFSPDDDNINWCCWDCALTDSNVEPLRKGEQISNGISGSAELTIDSHFPILDSETQFLEERIADHGVVEQKRAVPENPSHSEEHNELAEMNCTFAPTHEENNPNSYEETQKIEEDGRKKRIDSANSPKEGKTINLQASFAAPVDHCIGSNELSGKPSLEPDDCFSAEPVMDPIWRGRFNIREESETSVEIFAHLSNKAGFNISEAASALPPAVDASHAPEASTRPPLASKPTPVSTSPPADSATAGPSAAGPNTSHVGPSTAPPSLSFVAPPPPPVVRPYISLSDAWLDRDFHSAIGAVVRAHFPHPWPRYKDVPPEHQRFWFQQLKFRYCWDCTDHDMFKVFKIFAGKYIRRNFCEARKTLVQPLWLANEIWRQLLEYWGSPKFLEEAAKNKANQAANAESAATVYRGGSSSVGMHKRKLELQLGRPPKQMELFSKCYKRKTDGNCSGPRAKQVAEIFLKMLDDQQAQAPADAQELPASSVGTVTQTEQQLWISAIGSPNKGRVFGMGSEAHMSAAGPSQKTAPPPPPQARTPNPNTVKLKDRVARMEKMMMHMMTHFPIPPMPMRSQPPADDPATANESGDDDEEDREAT